jgi:V/A-type H+-transporting ATPase subunit E
MPIKDIKEKIIKDALEEKEKIIKDAEIKIENFKKQQKEENESIRRDIMERYMQEAELKEKKIITEAKLNAKKDILAEKQAIIDEIFLEVTKRINKLEDKEYLPLIEKLILENVEQGDEIVYIGEQERKSINQEFIAEINKKLKSQGKKGELKLAKERLPIKGGVILGTEEIKKNASLEVLLEKIKSETETRLNQFLFYKNNEE